MSSDGSDFDDEDASVARVPQQQQPLFMDDSNDDDEKKAFSGAILSAAREMDDSDDNTEKEEEKEEKRPVGAGVGNVESPAFRSYIETRAVASPLMNLLRKPSAEKETTTVIKMRKTKKKNGKLAAASGLGGGAMDFMMDDFQRRTAFNQFDAPINTHFHQSQAPAPPPPQQQQQQQCQYQQQPPFGFGLAPAVSPQSLLGSLFGLPRNDPGSSSSNNGSNNGNNNGNSSSDTEAALSLLLEEEKTSEKGLTTVSIASLVQLMDLASSAQSAPPPPKPATILSASLKGEANEGSSVKFTCNYKVLVLNPGCTVTRLLMKEVALDSVSVSRASAFYVPPDDPSAPSSSPLRLAEDAEKDLVEPEQQPSMVLDGDYHALMVFQSGCYSVEITAYFPFNTERKSSVAVTIPTAAQTDLEFTVFRDIQLAQPEQVQIGVVPFLQAQRESFITPSATHPLRGTVVSTLRCKIPPSVSVNIKWNPKSEEDIKAEAKKKEVPLPLHTTVEQEHNLSVLENLLTVYSEFHYSILNGSLSLFELCCDTDLKVLNVEVSAPSSTIKRWDASIVQPEDPGYDELVPSEEVDKDVKRKGRGKPRQLLRVVLDYAVEGRMTLFVSSEKELPSNSCQFVCPTFRHVRSSVTREKGFIAVDSLPTVEVEQVNPTSLVAILDVSEVPASLSKRAVNPLVLAYKFLVPAYEVLLDVKKHADVEVLTASADEGYFIFTLTDEGKCMYSLSLVIRNTQKQYLRVATPRDAEIWSTVVNQQSVKPARDSATGEVLIPLQKLGGPEDEPSKTGGVNSKNASTSKSGYTQCVVEFLYVRTPAAVLAESGSSSGSSKPTGLLRPPVIGKPPQLADPSSKASGAVDAVYVEPPVKELSNTGLIEFSFPTVDVPINVLAVSCFLPNEYMYGEFEGDLKEISYFSQYPLDPSRLYPSSSSSSSLQEQNLVMAGLALEETAYEFKQQAKKKKGGGIVPFSLSSPGTRHVAQNSRANAKGIVPVKVEMVKTGTEFKFERLLVVSQQLRLSVEYKKRSKSGQRNIDGACVIA